MSSSFEKSVRGATKIKAAPPKTKYIEHILVATHSGEHGVAEVFRSLQSRLRDSTWTVVFKSLITVHLMIREGAQDVTLEFLSKHRSMLATSGFTDAQTQGRNIRHYSNYLTERGRAYRDTKIDWVRGAERRLEKATIEKGLLRETEIVQAQIAALLKCDVLANEPDNEITITIFRMLVLDLLTLFHIMNQGLINILGHFFEMSMTDAERSLQIYRNFAKQTDLVVQYMAVAREYSHQTRVEVPKLKHAPITLGKSLQDYLADPDFETNRRQYLAEIQATRGGSSSAAFEPSKSTQKTAPSSTRNVAPAQTTGKAAPLKAPAPDLIDFFESIDPKPTASNGHPAQQMPAYTGAPQFYNTQPQQYQQTGFQGHQQQYTSSPQPQSQSQPYSQPAQHLNPQSTGFGFGGYSPQQYQNNTLQSMPQDSQASFQPQQTGFNGMAGTNQQMQPQSTNPFRMSMMMNTPSPQQYPQSPPNSAPIQLQPQSTNPFARSNASSPQVQQQQFSPQVQQQPFSPPPESQPQPQTQSMQQAPAPRLVPMATGTNPFAKGYGQVGSTPVAQIEEPAQQANGLVPQQTGSTNPFRESQFMNTGTGQGWQSRQGMIGGGLDQLETVPVFPRPATSSPWR